MLPGAAITAPVSATPIRATIILLIIFSITHLNFLLRRFVLDHLAHTLSEGHSVGKADKKFERVIWYNCLDSDGPFV